jgi:2'-phosphotransferase
MIPSSEPSTGEENKDDRSNDDREAKRAKNWQHRSKSNISSSLKELSHTLSWILRHKAIELGLTMTPDGFVQVKEILDCQHPRIRGRHWNIDHVRQVVETNDKQRYKIDMKPASQFQKKSTNDLNDAGDNNCCEKTGTCLVLCVRANQGHSISTVDSNLLLTELTSDDLVKIPMIVHGTFKDAWERFIRVEGLSRMKRNHIHFTTGLPRDEKVISGIRKSCDVYIYIDVNKCVHDKIKFFRSENGVILCSGINDDGVLPPSYFERVTDALGKSLIDDM